MPVNRRILDLDLDAEAETDRIVAWLHNNKALTTMYPTSSRRLKIPFTRTSQIGRTALLIMGTLFFGACSKTTPPQAQDSRRDAMPRSANNSRIVFLHHSTGETVWKAGLPAFIQTWNKAHSTAYEIQEQSYPAATGGHTRLRRMLPERLFNKIVSDRYPWDNYPYDYWNLWVAHSGEQRDKAELNLEDLVQSFDVIVFKHCFPVSGLKADDGSPNVASRKKTLANYQLQYEALKTRMHQYPNTRFILWTGAALTQASSNPEDAERARQFSTWVKETWDEQGDNIFIWDFRELETEGGLYLKPEHAYQPDDSHPSMAFAAKVAPLLGKRIVDVIEGRGDCSSLTGQ